MEGAPSDAAARGEPRKAPADGSASKGSAEEENSFDRLPDELVQRIFSELEATEAYERIRLWAVDRRFGRLVRGVHWKELRIGVKLPRDGEGRELYALASQQFEQLARRAIARLKHGAFLGAARVVVGSLCHRRWARELQGHEVHEPAVDEIGAIQKAAYATTTLLGALATSPVPPREVQFDSFGAGRGLLSVGEEERQLQDLLSMERLALSLLLALCPADSLHSLVVSGSDWLGQSVAEVARPGAVPPAVHRLELEGDSLSGENMECFALTALRRAWPGLQSLRCSGISREALVELAAFHNLSEITAEMSASDEDNHNMGLDPFSWDMDAELAIIASSPCAPRLRVFDLFPCVGPAGLRSLLGFCALERLTVEVDHRSTGVLHGLAELSMLRSIFLLINVRDATDEGAGLLRAAGAAIEACKRLERTEISVFVEAPVGNRSVFGGDISSQGAPPSTFLEVAQGGPKLELVDLEYRPPQEADLVVLSPLLRLRGGLPEGRPALKVNVSVSLRESLWNSASSIVDGWFLTQSRACARFSIEVGRVRLVH
eukprot:tig00000605_g2472.t1